MLCKVLKISLLRERRKNRVFSAEWRVGSKDGRFCGLKYTKYSDKIGTGRCGNVDLVEQSFNSAGLWFLALYSYHDHTLPSYSNDSQLFLSACVSKEANGKALRQNCSVFGTILHRCIQKDGSNPQLMRIGKLFITLAFLQRLASSLSISPIFPGFAKAWRPIASRPVGCETLESVLRKPKSMGFVCLWVSHRGEKSLFCRIFLRIWVRL